MKRTILQTTLAALLIAAAPALTLTDKKGRKLECELVSVDATSAVVTTKGKQHTIPLADLSPASVAAVRAEAAPPDFTGAVGKPAADLRRIYGAPASESETFRDWHRAGWMWQAKIEAGVCVAVCTEDIPANQKPGTPDQAAALMGFTTARGWAAEAMPARGLKQCLRLRHPEQGELVMEAMDQDGAAGLDWIRVARQ